jgi:hypothetical protein
MDSDLLIPAHPSAVLLKAQSSSDSIFRLAWFRLCDLYPEVAQRIANDLSRTKRPLVLSDLKEIKRLVYAKKEPKTNREKQLARDLYIAVVVSIYDPARLVVAKGLRKRLRAMLVDVLEHKGSASGISQRIRLVKDLLDVSRPFSLEVQAFTEWVLSKIDQQQK